MLVSLFQVFSFASENIVWLLFATIVVWIIFAPQFNRFLNRKPKSQRYFLE